jgi:hypothetical protein
MNQSRHGLRWQRWVALLGLFSLLALSIISAAHVHGAATSGMVRQECQLCLTGGMSRVLPVTVPLFAVVVLGIFLLIAPATQPRVVACFRPHDPRSPPVSL